MLLSLAAHHPRALATAHLYSCVIETVIQIAMWMRILKADFLTQQGYLILIEVSHSFSLLSTIPWHRCASADLLLDAIVW